MNESEKDLYLPINTPDADDLIQGIGTVELYIYSIGLAVCLAAGLWINFAIKNTVVATITAISLFALIVLLFRRNLYNENVLKITMVVLRFQKSQKIFEYVFHNIYEIAEEDEVTDDEAEDRNRK